MASSKKDLLFSFVIPSYNASKHLNTSLPSILNERMKEEGVLDFFEVIIVDDGSKDNTLAVAREYAKKWNAIKKDLVKVITKKNGQYGSVINAALKEAKGRYFKVLDADDWFHTFSLIELIYIVRGIEIVDVIFTDHVFEKVLINSSIPMLLSDYFTPNKVVSVANEKFPKDLITMHSIIYRTEHLKKIHYRQTENIFYSDSEYSILPLIHAKTMYYSPIQLYRYYIGSSEQSINLKVMVKNRLHQYKVIESLLMQIDFDEIKYKNIREYILLTLKRMIQWQLLLIIYDEDIDDKQTKINDLFQLVEILQPFWYKHILSGKTFGLLKFTKGYGVTTLIKVGARLYSKFKKNILAEWD